ncbi:hypothetical protein NE539_01720 [Flavonifractor plautii]|mgnify:FL=1|jgi:hypothetical protein|uniref:hypothetical protein n=1 Tax=Flavonifractor plautii TaxID=292800 RepID=UPI002108B4DC|nr:hypothetical protein [Flavonifractor plautii]MCQ4992016.1 hypothetical protein [Flavonifractor plautii]
MSYEQAMRHTKNHRKDRFCQQCSGYFGDGTPEGFQLPEEVFSDLSAKSMEKILGAVKEFPVYLHQKKTGEWELVPKNHLFGQEIGSLGELAQFASDYA